MEGGRDWWRQIEEAITKAEYLVLLLHAEGSGHPRSVPREWRYARQQGTYVIPVCDGPPSKLELHQLAGWMRRADSVDSHGPGPLDLGCFGKLEAAAAGVRRVPMMAEAPPADFVPRLAELVKAEGGAARPSHQETPSASPPH